MQYFINKPPPHNKILVGLEENVSTGEVSVTLNGVQHLSFSKEGDVVFYAVDDACKIAGVKYTNNEISKWG